MKKYTDLGGCYYYNSLPCESTQDVRYRSNKFRQLLLLTCFDIVFQRPYRSFSIALKVILSSSDRYKIFTREKATRGVSPFLAWGDFHARSRFARSTIPEENGKLLVVYENVGFSKIDLITMTTINKKL